MRINLENRLFLMTTYLTLNCALRAETDQSIIDNLERKGWVITTPPNYDPVTEQPPVWEACDWVVRPIPAPEPYRVSKDTIVSRISQFNKLPDLINLTSSLPTDQKYLWDHFAWFWSNNQTVRAMAVQMNLDPDAVLAPDPFLN